MRLAASVAELYGARLDPDAAQRAQTAASAARERSRLRILAEPDGAIEVTVSPAPQPGPGPLTLAPFELPGGLGAHKWRDRRLLDALSAEAAGAVPLIVDSDGLVLEAAHANVWIVQEGALVTPPADGRILPGVTRARLLTHEPSAREEPIDLARLEAADEIVLTSSISGRRTALLRGQQPYRRAHAGSANA
jgi:para-aminobenzoate synthetase / 4-amino-4-deoxychorismate lyase